MSTIDWVAGEAIGSILIQGSATIAIYDLLIYTGVETIIISGDAITRGILYKEELLKVSPRVRKKPFNYFDFFTRAS